MSEQIKKQNRVTLRRFGIGLTLLGLFLFVFGAEPGFFGLDRSEAVGFVQISVFTFGLFLLCLGGSFSLSSLWSDNWQSISADIGLRLAWTGFVIAMAAGMADIFGLGTRPIATSTTFFGYWQARGVLIGQIVIGVGFLMMIPYRRPKPPADNKETGIKREKD